MDKVDVYNAEIMRRYLAPVILGGLSGAVSIIVAVIGSLNWECRHWDRGCYDGQGGIVLVELVPLMFIIGGLLGASWAWLRPKLPSAEVLTRKHIGPWNLQWLVVRLALPIGFWCLMCISLFWLLIYIDQF
jgi:hypothetical protein